MIKGRASGGNILRITSIAIGGSCPVATKPTGAGSQPDDVKPRRYTISDPHLGLVNVEHVEHYLWNVSSDWLWVSGGRKGEGMKGTMLKFRNRFGKSPSIELPVRRNPFTTLLEFVSTCANIDNASKAFENAASAKEFRTNIRTLIEDTFGNAARV